MRNEVTRVLSKKIDKGLIIALLKYYDETQTEFVKGDWEATLVKAGKFVEAALKCLHYWTEKISLRSIKVGDEIIRLENLSKNSFPDNIRLLIPRACRTIYGLASDRGGRHDITGFNPNRMDATIATAGTSWIVAEFLRYFHEGPTDAEEAQKMGDALVIRKYPIIEQIDGKTFIDSEGWSARETMLVLLHINGAALAKKELFDQTENHGFKRENASASLSYMKTNQQVFENKAGVINLRRKGSIEAEDLLTSKSENE